jgi:hypothetical protein
VPFQGATWDLHGIKSTTNLHDFCVKLTEKMGTQLTLLSHIGYISSYKPKNTKTKQNFWKVRKPGKHLSAMSMTTSPAQNRRIRGREL